MVRCKGFSLAELAVTMLIVSLLLAGALIPFGTQIDLKNVADTQRTMDSIREAMVGFAQANGRLPCPASGTIATGAANAGTEQFVSGQCSANEGVVPWATLGVPETDGWGRRFSYYVVKEISDGNTTVAVMAASNPGLISVTTAANHGYSTGDVINISGVTGNTAANGDWTVTVSTATQFTLNGSAGNGSYISGGTASKGTWSAAGQWGLLAQNPACTPTPLPNQPASFALCTQGVLTVNTRDDMHNANPIGIKLPAVIISHGKNGYGAYTPAGSLIAAPAGWAGSDEAVNAFHAATTGIYYNRTPTRPASGCNDPAAGSSFCEFDDLVVMITSNVLIARMVSAGRLP